MRISSSAGSGVSFCCFLASVLAYQFWIFGHVVYWNAYNPSSTAFMEIGWSSLQQKNPAATLRVRWVPYEQISQISSERLSRRRTANSWSMKGLISMLCKKPIRKT